MVWRKFLQRLDSCGRRPWSRSGAQRQQFRRRRFSDKNAPAGLRLLRSRSRARLPQVHSGPVGCDMAFRRQAANQAPRCIRQGLFAGFASSNGIALRRRLVGDSMVSCKSLWESCSGIAGCSRRLAAQRLRRFRSKRRSCGPFRSLGCSLRPGIVANLRSS
jgi:hypothetical protein